MLSPDERSLALSAIPKEKRVGPKCGKGALAFCGKLAVKDGPGVKLADLPTRELFIKLAKIQKFLKGIGESPGFF